METELTTVPTPALVVERGIVTRNAARMKARAASLGVRLRPHLKTVKSAEIASFAVDGQGAAVSTLREASYFAAHGHEDLVLAVCVTPSRLDAVAALQEQGATVRVITDDLEVAEAIARHPARLRAWIEIDCGGARTGVAPEGEALLGLAQALGDRCDGVLTHAGHSYGAHDAATLTAIAEEERSGAVHAAERLREAGVACPHVSVGSTPTAAYAEHLEGVTELRPGVYLFGDLFQVGLGVCAPEDQALTVLTTVMSARPGQVVVDAGGLALSKDRSTSGTPFDAGYGVLCDLEGVPLPGRPVVSDVHQEHGIVRAETSLRVGDRVRVQVNHACMTAAAYDHYWVVDGGGTVVDRWWRCNGW